MGDIFKKVKVCGLGIDGRRKRCRTVTALLDTGATVSVISAALARELGGAVARRGDSIEGRTVPIMLAESKMLARDCGRRVKPLVVDDELARRAGRKAQMILGSDYMQRTRLAILMSTDLADEGVAWRRGKPPRRR